MQTRSFLLYLAVFLATASTIAHLYCAKKHTPQKHIHPLLIIGGGVGGLSAGIEAGKLQPLIFQGESAGGLLTKSYAIQNWPGIPNISGQDLISKLEQEAQDAGATLVQETVINISRRGSIFEIATTTPKGDKKTYSSYCVLVSTGTTPLKLDIPGEETYWGRGISNCAVCDGGLFKGKTVAVVGGGETALEEAQYLSSLAKKVYLIVRKPTFKSHESTHIAHVLNSPNITVLFNTIVTEVLGTPENLNRITIVNTTSQKTSSLSIDGLFEAIGSQPNSTLLRKLSLTDGQQNAAINPDFSTRVPGVFVIGDVTNSRYKQAIIASQQAAQATTSIQNYLSRKKQCDPTAQITQPRHALAEHRPHTFTQNAQHPVENCLIIGSGSAGLTAALYLAHAGMQPRVIQGPNPGGSLVTQPLTHPWVSLSGDSGQTIAFNLKKHARSAGAHFELSEVVEIDTQSWPYHVTCASPATGNKKHFYAKSILLTTHQPISIHSHKKIEKDSHGFYKTTARFESSIPHIFATGPAIMDIHGHHIVSAGQGAEAALNINDIVKAARTAQPTTEVAPQPAPSKKTTSIPHLHSIAEYNKAINQGGKMVIDCFAHWCPPCKRLKPVLENINTENMYPDVQFYAIDVDEAEDLSGHLMIKSLPTLIFMQNGKEVRREYGFSGEEWLHQILKSSFKKP